jgi:7-cyano-7-deazaguanine synthase
MRKPDVFKKGKELGVDYASTWSCIRGSSKHCGECGACRSRRRAFLMAGLSDPTDYAREPLALETTGITELSA